MAEELQFVVVTGRTSGGTAIRLSGTGVDNAIFVAEEPPPEGGGTIGTNSISPKFRRYVERLEAEEPITFALEHVTKADLEAARKLAFEYDRHVVLLRKHSLT